MTQITPLTDKQALALHRARATQAGAFLHEEAIDEIQEKLIDVNRSFTSPAIVTGFPKIWSQLLPNATIIPDDETLNLRPGAHDLVIHAMSLHWANDPVGQIIQCRRALQPDGLFLSVSFGGQTLNELRSVLAETEIALQDGISPRIAPMAEIRDLGAILQRAGLALPVADSLSKSVHYSSLLNLLHDLRAMGETNALYARRKNTLPKAFFPMTAKLYGENFPAPEGRITATFELVFLTGWAPSENQPKALRPGSATTRLADALGTTEFTENTPPKLDDPK